MGYRFDHEISAHRQIVLLQRAQTAYYVSLVLMQMATAITCETRTSSLVMQHGLFTNKYLNICLIAEFLLAVAVVYVPALNELLHTEPLEPACWFSHSVYDFAVRRGGGSEMVHSEISSKTE